MANAGNHKPLSWNEIKSRALNFSRTWHDAASEDSDAKPFWYDFLDILGIQNKRVATFELNVKLHAKKEKASDGFVDFFVPGKLLVEHKSRGKNLDDAMKQAFGYLEGIPDHKLPKLIVVSDFARFRLYWLQTKETVEFPLGDLHKNISHFGFLIGYSTQRFEPQNPVNIRAAERMGELHDRLKESGFEGHQLELLLVRLLFCLFADDTGIFQPAEAFRDFLETRTSSDGSDTGPLLARLFQVLNTAPDSRSVKLDESLAAFPYVNGRLFEETAPIADFDTKTRDALLAACALDWSGISPAIFGSLFQSIMDEKARRNLGAHYTSEENILKLIKPLFLDDLRAELEGSLRNREKLLALQRKLSSLTFFDPACGCGNFLVISYRELRLLELDLLHAINKLSSRGVQQQLEVSQLMAINVDQFYGIEIEEFPAQIAQVALWLVDHQMNLRVGEEFGQYVARIPLTKRAKIVNGNALRLDWNEVLPASRCSYILGNPPFVGGKFMDDAQRADTRLVFDGVENSGLLDFVAAWYVLAARYTAGNPETACAFVSTNSIVQGEQVGVLWGWMLAQGMRISFAHRTFSWSNEAKGKAAVHCVIVGFGRGSAASKTIFEYQDIKGDPLAVSANNINPYLVDAPDVVLVRRSKPLSAVPEIGIGSQPIDDGNYLFTTAERDEFITAEPASAIWFRRWLGADEFINGFERWCLWLEECPPSELRKMPLAMRRVDAVKRFRLKSKRSQTLKAAASPAKFGTSLNPTAAYILIPRVSSEQRAFVPFGFVSKETFCSDAVLMLPNGTLHHLGVLSSNMHNAWIRYTAGRLESRYRYSKDIVYNNFPWPDPDAERAVIETAAQGVLDARALFQQGEKPASLADLYDPLTMPPALVKAHQKLDAAVDRAYAATAKRLGGKDTPTAWKTDAERVAFLFKLYAHYTAPLAVEAEAEAKPAARRPRKAKKGTE
jgi:hypothetical protein